MPTIHTKSDEFMADLRRAYRAEFDRTPGLQAEFLSAADYAGYMIAENSAMIQKMREHYEEIQGEAARQRAIRAGLLHARN